MTPEIPLGSVVAGPPPVLPFELLEAKLRVPQLRHGTVSRESLIGSLDGAAAAPLVFVSAGPGWGKTTLLAEWAATSERPFAWMSVDERDNDPIVFLTYIAVALDRVSSLDQGVFEALASPGVSVQATVVPRLGAALATMDRPTVLVLDDLHLLVNAACLDAIVALARHLPERSQLALSARGAAALSLGALRAHGFTQEVGPDDLRMDVVEAQQLLSMAGLTLSDEEVAELTEHTEGWSAGLYLAALSIKAGGSRVNAATFSGGDRLVSDYLGSELLSHVSAGDMRFLTRTAVLERMSGPLCDAVVGGTGSAATLESLARSNLFLVPLDGSGEWYRYHHLFGELLRAELGRAAPELLPLLLDRAATWCEANGQPEGAIAYAQAAGDVDRVARLVEWCAMPAYQSGRSATAEHWFAWLEEHGALERNAVVAVLGSLLAAVQGRATEAERRADAAERGSYDGPLPDGSPAVDSWRAVLRALRCANGAARMRDDAEAAVRTVARQSQLWPSALVLSGISLVLVGEIEAADDVFADVVEEGRGLGASDTVAVALAERAALAIGQGQWVRAEEFAERGLAVTRQFRMEEYPTSALAYAVAARVALHLGNAARVQELLSAAQRVRPSLTYAMPHLAVQTRLELARAYLTLADAGGAETMVRELDVLLRRQPDLGTLPTQVAELREILKTLRADSPGASTLSGAELRLLPYLATHLSFREIGERLYISRHTVKSQATAIYRKLSVTSRTGAVERAGELGLL